MFKQIQSALCQFQVPTEGKMDSVTKIAMAFEHGGIWMYPIMMIQMVSFAIIIERIYALYIRRKANQT